MTKWHCQGQRESTPVVLSTGCIVKLWGALKKNAVDPDFTQEQLKKSLSEVQAWVLFEMLPKQFYHSTRVENLWHRGYLHL